METVVLNDGRVISVQDDGTWTAYQVSGLALEKMQSLEIPDEIVQTFKGIFRKLGIRICDTGEELTCIHHGERIEFVPGIVDKDVDFAIEIFRFKIDRLAKHISSGSLDRVEEFRVARELFQMGPGGVGNVTHNPLVASALLRRMIRGKQICHIYLVSPDPSQEPNAEFSFVFVNKKWLVIPGFHGEAQRVFRITVDDAVALQKRLFRGMQKDSWLEWMRIARWYVKWRKQVEA